MTTLVPKGSPTLPWTTSITSSVHTDVIFEYEMYSMFGKVYQVPMFVSNETEALYARWTTPKALHSFTRNGGSFGVST